MNNLLNLTEKVVCSIYPKYSDKHTITNCSEPDQTLHHRAFYQGLHCLSLKYTPKYLNYKLLKLLVAILQTKRFEYDQHNNIYSSEL